MLAEDSTQEVRICKYIQPTLVISTSIISNNRLSRRENLVLVLTQKSNISKKIVWIRGEILLRSNISPFPQYFQSIFLTESNYIFFMKCVCILICIFLGSANLMCRSTDISK